MSENLPKHDIYENYYQSRYQTHKNRDRIWADITSYLLPFWNLKESDEVLELGCGYGSWIRAIPASRKHGLDINPELPEIFKQSRILDVTAHVGSCLNLSEWENNRLKLVLASNLLEHLFLEEVFQVVKEVCRILQDGGAFCIIQPNFALCPKQYFDDYTHRTIFTDISLSGLLEAAGLKIRKQWRGLLPFSMKGVGGDLSFLAPFYLRSPWRPFAKQMCFIAEKP
jgi:ubiquinone/menaquinone biosynthesis C-methylase UbiE